MFQVLYKQNWTTWFAYVVTLAEQLIIVVILLVLKCKNQPDITLNLSSDNSNDSDNSSDNDNSNDNDSDNLLLGGNVHEVL